MKLHLAASLLALPLLAGAIPALAQDYDPPSFGGAPDDRGGGYDRGGYERGATEAPDAAGVEVRVGKLEKRLREMTGQIEELQNANRKLIEQVQKFQQDVDSRLSSGSGGRGKRAEAVSPPSASTPAPTADVDSGKPTRRARRDDAYDPDSAPGGDSGRPKQLGSAASAAESGANSPMDLSGGRLRNGGSSDSIAPTLRLPSNTKSSSTTAGASGPAAAASIPGSPRAEFDAALGLYKGKQYEDAEKGFSAFIQKNPKSRLAADATYYLGESFAQRGRSREAAEQYLKVSTDYSSSTRAPDAMLHLGMSLKALGAKEQACATFSEVNRKYPNAPSYVKSGVEREAKRAQCG